MSKRDVIILALSGLLALLVAAFMHPMKPWNACRSCQCSVQIEAFNELSARAKDLTIRLADSENDVREQEQIAKNNAIDLAQLQSDNHTLSRQLSDTRDNLDRMIRLRDDHYKQLIDTLAERDKLKAKIDKAGH